MMLAPPFVVHVVDSLSQLRVDDQIKIGTISNQKKPGNEAIVTMVINVHVYLQMRSM